MSHAQALQKAKEEYRKYQEATLSPVEEAYIETVKEADKTVKRELKKMK